MFTKTKMWERSRLAKSARSGKGFSLPEMIAVLTIIAILMSVAVPSFLSQQKKSRESAQRADLLSVVSGVQKILNGYKGAPPQVVVITTNTSTNTWTANLGTTSGTVLDTGKTGAGDNVTGSPTATVANTAIWTDGTYCIQSVNNASATPTLRFQSNTQTIESGACPATVPGGMGSITAGSGVNVPPAPTAPTVSNPAANRVQVNWSAVTAVPAVTNYIVEIEGMPAVQVGNVLTATVNNVPGTDGNTIPVVVRAKNSNGAGPTSSATLTSVSGSASLSPSLTVSTLFTSPGNSVLGETSYTAGDYYGAGTVNGGYNITTTIPWSAWQMPFVHVTGYAYGAQQPIDFWLTWYAYTASGQPRVFRNIGYVNNGAWDPGTITLYTTADNFVGIHISNTTTYVRFTVDANQGSTTNHNSAYLVGWTTNTNPVPADAANQKTICASGCDVAPSTRPGVTYRSNVTMTSGSTLLGLPATPTAATEATSKTYVDTKASLAGATFTGVVQVPNGAAATDALNKGQIDALLAGKANTASPTFTGTSTFNGTVVVPVPSAQNQAAQKQQVDEAAARTGNSLKMWSGSFSGISHVTTGCIDYAYPPGTFPANATIITNLTKANRPTLQIDNPGIELQTSAGFRVCGLWGNLNYVFYYTSIQIA